MSNKFTRLFDRKAFFYFTSKTIFLITFILYTFALHFENVKPVSDFLIGDQKIEIKMSRVCQLTGKRPIVGNNVSHANNKTKRRFLPNLQKKRFFIPELNKTVTLKVSTSAMRTINKLGIYEYLLKLERKGVDHGVDMTKG